MKFKVWKRLIIFWLSSYFLYSCTIDHIPPAPPIVQRTLIFYLLPGELDNAIERNIHDLLEGYKGGDYEIIIYRDRKGTTNIPYLYQVVRDKERWTRKFIMSFPKFDEKGYLTSTMSSVLDTIKHLFPAQSYGLCISTHGRGWLPGTTYTHTRSLGPQDDQLMSSKELADAIPNQMFEFILFDACYMGCAEVAYDLREKAKWIIASEASIPRKGFPYKNIVNELLSCNELETMKIICDRYMVASESKEYNNYGGCISLIDLRHISSLHSKIANILPQISDYIKEIDITLLQGYTKNEYQYAFTDMKDFIDGIPSESIKTELSETFKKCVVYSKNHPIVFDGLDLIHCNGLSFYIPNGLSFYIPNGLFKDINSSAHAYYFTLDWAQDLNWKVVLTSKDTFDILL